MKKHKNGIIINYAIKFVIKIVIIASKYQCDFFKKFIFNISK